MFQDDENVALIFDAAVPKKEHESGMSASSHERDFLVVGALFLAILGIFDCLDGDGKRSPKTSVPYLTGDALSDFLA